MTYMPCGINKKFLRYARLLVIIALFTAVLVISCSEEGDKISYCSTSLEPTRSEAVLLQAFIPTFAKQFGWNIGNICISKWHDRNKQSISSNEFRIAWETACGPVISNRAGDDGYVSTFVCAKDGITGTCCWPLGFARDNRFMFCSDK